MFRNNLIKLIIVLLFLPQFIFAEDLNSTNYRLINPTFDGGGESSSSTNYTSLDSIADEVEEGQSSTNYKNFLGFIYSSSPSIPAAPTLTNTGGSLYNSLDFVIATGGNQTDTNYAIAISNDDFVTTYFIQTDDTIASTVAWQSYAGWGSGTGERVTGLAVNSTYKIKVKARYGPDSETGYSVTASASTSSPSLTITFAGVNSGTTIAGETTTKTTTANTVPFASLIVSTAAVAAHQVTVSTNGVSGYVTTLQQDGELRNLTQQIDPVAATNSAPAAWPGGITTGKFGYHTTDSVLCSGSTNRFSANDTYAKLTTSPEEVACNSGPVSSEQTTVIFKLQIGSLQPAGTYGNILTYITTAKF